MKKTRTLLAVLLSLALLVSLASVTATAAETVESYLNFAEMESTQDLAAATAAIKAAGAVDAVNLKLVGNFHPVATAGGYAGPGYVIQKVEAPAGEFLASAKLDLGYWLTNAANQYVSVEASADGVTYTEVARYTEGNGAAFENSVQKVTIDLPVAAGQTAVYVKVTAVCFDTWEGGALEYSKLIGTVGAAEPVVKDPTVSEIIFATMASTDNVDAAVAAIKAAGAVDAANLKLAGNHDGHRGIANPGGYAGEGWVIQKVSAPEGKTLASAKLELGYWLTTNASQGYVQVWSSNDGTNFTMVKEFKEGNGPAFENSVQTATIDIPASGAEVYVKIVVQHWDTWEGAAIDSSKLVGTVKADTPVNPPVDDPVNPPVDSDPTGDIITTVIALMAVCAAGIIVTSKKFR